MSNETFSPSVDKSELRLQRLKLILDRFVTLARSDDEAVVTQQAKVLVEELKHEAQPVRQLDQFEQLATLSTQIPDEDPQKLEIHQLIDSTADFILGEVGETAPAVNKQNVDNIHSAWAAINAWDTTRSEATAKLCVAVLQNFRGSGQPQLARAYGVARKDGIPFNQALDAVNEEFRLVA